MRTAACKSAPPLREIIYSHIVDDIVHGRIGSGERLSEASLGQRFSVSKPPIREALIQLEREGYIVLKKNVGAVVQKMSGKIVNEIFTTVAVLEAYALEAVVAGKMIQKSDIDFLTNIVQNMERFAQKKQYFQYRPLNIEFHGFFIEKLGNDTMKKNVQELRKRMYSFVAGGLTLTMHIDRYVECHRNILELVKQGKAVWAAAMMRSHVLESKGFLLRAMEGFSGSPHQDA